MSSAGSVIESFEVSTTHKLNLERLLAHYCAVLAPMKGLAILGILLCKSSAILELIAGVIAEASQCN